MNNILKLQSKLSDQQIAVVFDPYNQRYYTGIDTTDGMLVVTSQQSWFYTDFRYIIAAKQHVKNMNVCLLDKPYSEVLKNHINGCTSVLFEENYMTYSLFRKLFDAVDVEFLPGEKIITSVRSCKDSEELQYISQSQDITDKGFSFICDYISSNKHKSISEKDVAFQLEFYLRSIGSGKMPFDIICASGLNSACPHAVPSDKIICEGDFVTIDFGSTVNGYCSDMTRTVAVGYVTDKQKDIYNLVLKAQLDCLNKIHSGVNGRDIDAVARNLFSAYGYKKAFGHSLGHSVGLYIHETPCFSPSRNEIIPSGTVISVEPGLYFENEFGVRIEDLICVTDDGYIDFTHSKKDLVIL